jgi:hypothetical protein
MFEIPIGKRGAKRSTNFLTLQIGGVEPKAPGSSIRMDSSVWRLQIALMGRWNEIPALGGNEYIEDWLQSKRVP